MSLVQDYTELRVEQIELVNSSKSPSKLKLRQKFKAEPWFFKFEKLPINWLDVNILDVTWLVTCGVAKRPEYVDDGIPFLSAQNARPFKTNLNKIRYITEEQFKTLTVGGKPEKNDILYTRVGNCGEAAKIPYDFDFGIYVSLTLIKPIHELIDSDYLVAYLNSQYGLSQANVGAIGTGLKNLNVNNVRKYRIPLPPLPEQQRVVAKLDRLFAHLEEVKTRLEKVPELLKQFKQSVLTQAVTGKLTEEWREGKELKPIEIKETEKYELGFDINTPESWRLYSIGNVFTFQQGMQIAKNTRLAEPKQGALPILRIKNYHDGFQSDVEYVMIDEKSLIAEPEDIILTRTGESRGWVLTGFRGVFHNNTFRINFPKEQVNASYLSYYLSSPKIQWFIKTNSGRTGQPDLTHKSFGPCPVSIPSIQEQTEIVLRVEGLFAKADAIEAKYEQLKTRIDNLPQAILAKAFKGELVEQLPSDGSAEDLLKEIQQLKNATQKKK